MQKNTLFSYFFKVFKTGSPIKLFIVVGLISLFPFAFASADLPPTEVDEVNINLHSGPEDGMWGIVAAYDYVTVTKDLITLFTVQADDSGVWQCPESFEINPGDVFAVTAGAGINPIVVEIPDPIDAQANSASDEVYGQIQGWYNQPVSVYLESPFDIQVVNTDGSGNYSASFSDVPYAGQGHISIHNMVNYADVYYHQDFRTPDLVLETNYSYDWVQGHYDAGHTVELTVYDSYLVEGVPVNVKATAEIETGAVPQWGGESGFFTGMGDPWSPERPDIEPGDWVYGLVDNGYEAWLQVGTITGEGLNTGSDLISGTVDAKWLLPGPVNIECYIWPKPGPPDQYDTVIPNGSNSYECSWSGIWDIMPGDQIQVAYFEPEGHIVMREFHEPAPNLAIQKWFIGNGSPGEGGNAAFYVRYINQGDAPAEGVTIMDKSWVGIDYFHDSTGLPVVIGPGDIVTWDIGTVDPGEWTGFVFYGDVTATAGNPISNTVEIATTSPDMGELPKTCTWNGTVEPNDTHLSVSKEVWTFNPAPGEDFVYQVNVCNNGGTGSTDVLLTETLPDATTFNSWLASDLGWLEVSQSGQTLELWNASLPPGTCHEIYINVSLDELAELGDELVNTVEIEADNDMETEDNLFELLHEVGDPYYDISVWQEWHSGSLVPGGEYRLGIGYKNMGNVLISAPIEITATLPTGVTFAESDIPPDSMTATTVTWQIGSDLIAGMEGMIELQLDIDPSVTPGTLLTTMVDILLSDDDENPENDHHELAVEVNDPGLNMRVTKDGNWRESDVGQVAWWNIRVDNIGDEVVEAIDVTDYYPDDMELMGGIIYVNYWGDWGWNDNVPEDNAFQVNLEGLEPGESMNIIYETTVREEVSVIPGMNFSNIVEVTCDGDINQDDNWYEIVIVSPGYSTFLPLILR